MFVSDSSLLPFMWLSATDAKCNKLFSSFTTNLKPMFWWPYRKIYLALTVVYLCPNLVIQLPSVDCKDIKYNHSCCSWDQAVETKLLDSDSHRNQTKRNWVYTSENEVCPIMWLFSNATANRLSKQITKNWLTAKSNCTLECKFASLPADSAKSVK